MNGLHVKERRRAGSSYGSTWREVNLSEPCPVCGKSNWCSRPERGGLTLCRRVDVGAVCTKADAVGVPYYLHRVGPDARADREAAPPKENLPTTPRADDDTLHRAYRELQRQLDLAGHHRKALLARGLTEEQIDRNGYRTLPRSGRQSIALGVYCAARIDLLAVPGFFRAENGNWDLFGLGGLLVPVRDLKRRIVGWRIRPDDPGQGGKYRWLSAKPKGGSGPGARPHVPGWAKPAPVVRLTEGELKADVATVLSGVPTVSAPGVTMWRRCLPVLQEMGCREVLLAFDMDWMTKPDVAQQLASCHHGLARAGLAVALEVWS